MIGFRGFPPELFAFFEELANDNSKAYWQANKRTWETKVRDPMKALLAELDSEFPPLRMFRLNRDMRFSKDKSPYKTWAGATSESKAVGGTGYHLSVDASGLVVGYGAMAMARDQLQRFRAAIDTESAGHDFEELTEQLAAAALPVTPGAHPPLKTAPPGYAKTHARIQFLRWKGAAIVKEYGRADWMGSPQALDRIRDAWHGAELLKHWMDAHVGMSEE